MMTALVVYKALRLPVLVIAIMFITFYLYSKKRRELVETPKYRMLDED
ncbi:MAG TPA: cbb3-type cytochrome c oxidase subunit 3 [Leptospiraceae bacterium]|nr:cbb3-type cytochrome c oxidase subunit 3 [Leptospiraceae bacterium]HMW06194.1 cbb3-type cytochrome c oxidase subunit 3 [Leptospiraceae bacterium]HMX30678.1 cbb3-type cytochrome c oxidase subunit 3 [Leptospiraceae bacterium]HMY31855.1 cbb3-type cytochrome c oxidase subunit 3 [Leptospiraceae bacterium]HMZ64971.1 cbb3-type cytochrome c oxidase subunit 3 [Leptospiraceae bacterium]